MTIKLNCTNQRFRNWAINKYVYICSMEKKERKKVFTSMLRPSVKRLAQKEADKKGVSFAAYLETALLKMMGKK